MMHRSIMFWFSIMVVLFATPWANGQSVLKDPLSLETMAQRAHVVVLGECVDKAAAKSRLTIYRFDIEKRYKGTTTNVKAYKLAKTDQIELAIYDLNSGTTNAPTFDVGKDYILFLLAPNRNKYPAIIGFNQGALPIFKDQIQFGGKVLPLMDFESMLQSTL